MTESGNPSQPVNVSEYDASQIQVLEGLEAVRRRPGMYIGSTGERGLHQLVYEAVSYAVDEHLAGHADAIDVTLTADGGIRITDNGRGLPVEVEEPAGKPAIERELRKDRVGVVDNVWSRARVASLTSRGQGPPHTKREHCDSMP